MDTDSHTAPPTPEDNALIRFIGFWLDRRYIGRFLRLELLVLALICLTGVRAAANGHPLAGIATAAATASGLAWLLAAPGPFGCSVGHFTTSVWFAAFMLFAWMPLWNHWAGGASGHLAAWLTAWTPAALTGAAHDRIAGPILIGAKARRLLFRRVPAHNPRPVPAHPPRPMAVHGRDNHADHADPQQRRPQTPRPRQPPHLAPIRPPTRPRHGHNDVPPPPAPTPTPKRRNPPLTPLPP